MIWGYPYFRKHPYMYQHLQRCAKWFLKFEKRGVNSPSLRVELAPLGEGPGMYIIRKVVVSNIFF